MAWKGNARGAKGGSADDFYQHQTPSVPPETTSTARRNETGEGLINFVYGE